MADKINAAGYETKPWWPYVRELMEGGGSVTVEQLNVTENGTYTAEAGKAYSPVVVNVEGGIEGINPLTITAVLNEGVESTELSIMTYLQDGEPTDVKNCIAYDSNTFYTNYLSFSEESLNADCLYLLDYAYFMANAEEGISYEVSGAAEKITIEIDGETFTFIKASGDFTITFSALS